jgi:hypothetical protein
MQLRSVLLTQARCEELGVEICQKLLTVCVELAHSRDNIAWQTDTDDLHDSLKNEQCKVGKVGMRAVLVLEDLDETAIVGVVVGLRGHGDEVGCGGLEIAQAQRLGNCEEGHPCTRVVFGRGGGANNLPLS